MNIINDSQNRDGIAVEFQKRFTISASGCWEWSGNSFTARGGYGCATMRAFGIVNMRAHRLSWQLHHGPITSDQHVLHKCDNPKCVNPDHLFLGDQILNMADRSAKNRQNRGESHGMRKLSETQAIAIIADERILAEIAADHGVSIGTISDIKRGRSWKHLGSRIGRRASKTSGLHMHPISISRSPK